MMRKIGGGVVARWGLGGWESVGVSLGMLLLGFVRSDDGSGIDRGGRTGMRIGGGDDRGDGMKVGLSGEELSGRVDLRSGSVDVEVT